MPREKPEEQPLTNKQAIQILGRQAKEAAAVGDQKFVDSAHKVINVLLDEEEQER